MFHHVTLSDSPSIPIFCLKLGPDHILRVAGEVKRVEAGVLVDHKVFLSSLLFFLLILLLHISSFSFASLIFTFITLSSTFQ